MNNFQLRCARLATNFVPLALMLLLSIGAHMQLASADAAPTPANFLRYAIVATHPHDVTAFTQGLAVLDGELVESRGRYGQSAVTISAIASGAIRRRHDLEARHFGEGLAIAGRQLLQLTWQSGLAIAYDARLRRTGEYRYDGEGWGLAFDGRHWLMSDGSSRVTRRRTSDFGAVGALRVTDRGQPVRRLNELEFAQGRLYANVWRSDRVAVIEPASGEVEAWIDFAPLRRGFTPPADWNESEHVLNGIAYNPANAHFYVTGKCWPVLYEVRLMPLLRKRAR